MTIRLDSTKAFRAAQHPDRPGDQCKAPAGAWLPVIDRSRCEAKGDCVQVCPYSVFEVGPIDPGDLAALPWWARLKSRAHRHRTVYTPNVDACRSCGLCVVACPEHAVTLVRR